jgi:SAM-dependent methyltransferase
MLCWIKTCLRVAAVMCCHPKTGLSFSLRLLTNIPGIERSIEYISGRVALKQNLKSKLKNVGHALSDREIHCTIFGYQIFRLKIFEGAQATADQFFVNRPISDAKFIIKLASKFFVVKSNDLVFDPGCGAGRHLYYFVDRFNCQAIGADIYPPAIEVARIANWKGRVKFHCGSSIESNFLDLVLPNGCDFVFINSWLNHVKDYPGYDYFAARIAHKCRFLMIITNTKDRIDELFPSPKILVREVVGSTQYVILKGRL